MRALLIMLALVVGDVAHAGAAPQIEVSQTLVVPDGATLVGEGVMVLGNGGLPSGFRAGTRTTLRSAATLVGDIVNLGNGASLSRRAIEDLSGRLGGNLVVVSSRGPSDVVSATVDDARVDRALVR